MADNLDEKVSALVDGELPREEVDQLIMALKQDGGIQACWRHFHLISDAIKNAIGVYGSSKALRSFVPRDATNSAACA